MPESKPPLKQENNELSKIKKYFMYVLVASLSLAALISIVAIIIGDVGSVLQKSLATVFLIFVHALLSLAFISVDKDKTGASIIVNVTFGILIASFIVSSLGVWEAISGTLVGQMYQVFIITIFAAIFIELFYKLLNKDKIVTYLSYASMGSVVLVYGLFMPLIFAEYPIDLPNLYYRLFAASGVLAGTLTILTAIFHRLYVAKHPKHKLVDPNKKSLHPALRITLWILGVLGFLFIVLPITLAVLSAFVLGITR